jgi:hypothetical protein
VLAARVPMPMSPKAPFSQSSRSLRISLWALLTCERHAGTLRTDGAAVAVSASSA